MSAVPLVRPGRGRRGVAMVLALVVLAALLVLALPFLFSQSSSLAGARAAGWGGEAQRARGSADQLAVAAASYAQGLRLSPDLATQLGTAVYAYSELPSDINIDARYAGLTDASGRFLVDTGAAWPAGGALPSWMTQPLQPIDRAGDATARSGVGVEDQQGRADPNAFSAEAWGRVIYALKIPDPPTYYWNWYGWGPTTPGGNGVFGNTSNANGGPNGPAVDTLHPAGYFGEWIPVSYGRLALGLHRGRLNLASGRAVYLEQLLSLSPQCPNTEFARPNPYSAAYVPNTGASIPDPVGDPATGQSRTSMAGAQLPTLGLLNNTADYRNVPLTRSELESVRPYLSLDVPGQGRGGWVDFGTVVATHASGNGIHQGSIIDGLGSSRRVHGTYAFTIDRTTGDIGADWAGGWDVGYGTSIVAGDPAVLEVAPPLNLNVLVNPGNLVVEQSPLAMILGLSQANLNVIATGLEALPRWSLVDPAGGDVIRDTNGQIVLDSNHQPQPLAYERPPAAVTSLGIVAVDAAGLARDPQARAQAQHARRAIVQAVPQEHALQATWKSQAQIESLLRLRHGSWMVSGPTATARVSDFVSSDLLDTSGKPVDGWAEPGPPVSFQDNAATRVDWSASFGLHAARPWADVLKEERNANPQQAADSGGTAIALAAAKAALGPQGLRIGGSGVGSLTWPLVQPGGAGSEGMLRFGDTDKPETYTPGEMTGRSIAVSFRLENAPSGDIVLLEARAPTGSPLVDPANLPAVAAGTTAKPADATALWRVSYDSHNQMLVLAVANLAQPWIKGIRLATPYAGWKVKKDDPATPEVDERCSVGTGDFAAAVDDDDYLDRPEFRYKVGSGGLVAGRWYRLQVVCGGDRPGTMALILDGIVGRDAIAAQAFTWTGDHYVFPSLRLNMPGSPGGIARSDPATASDGGMALAKPDTITVKTPPAPDGLGMLPLSKVLPPRGMVRIDDEFFSYESIAGNQLKDVQRARRVNTNQEAPLTEDANGNGTLDGNEDVNHNGVLDAGEDANSNNRLDFGEDLNDNGVIDVLAINQRWPVTEAHADGALVVPGWSQVPVSSGSKWLRGNCTLASAFGDGIVPAAPDPTLAQATVDVTGANGFQDSDSDAGHRLDFGPGSTSGGPANPLIISVTGGGKWAPRGYVKITGAGQTWHAAYQYDGTQMTLDWGAPQPFATGTLYNFTAATTLGLQQISMEVSGSIAAATDFPDNGNLQLLDAATGECEWVRYEHKADRDAGGAAVPGKYFLADNGWPVQPPPGDSLNQWRGALRTAVRASDWPVGALVLPVQTGFSGTSRFEDGDVVTVVPAVIGSAAPALPHQIIVRHACRDGFPTTVTDSGSIYDTKNEYFALTAAVPAEVADPGTVPNKPDQVFLIGRGWGGDDLSPVVNVPGGRTRLGELPRIAAFQTPGSADARLFVGCPASGSGVEMVVDDLVAGGLPWNGDYGAPDGCRITAIVQSNTTVGQPSGSTTPVAIPASGTGTLPLQVTANQNVFPDSRWYGLALIDDEVFAYRRIDDTHADLIARSLLGSAASAHAIPADQTQVFTGAGTRTIQPGLSLVILPVGPVAELATSLAFPDAYPATQLRLVGENPVNYANRLTTSANRFQGTGYSPGVNAAPYQLIQSPDGASAEVTRLFSVPSSKFSAGANWLRGLFGTAHTGWTAVWAISSDTTMAYGDTAHMLTQSSGQLNPIVIGWWPRFAAATPDVAALSNTAPEFADFVRSRSATWAGYPVRLHGMRCDPAIPALAAAGSIADIEVKADGGCTVFARALGGRDDLGTKAKNLESLFAWDTAPEWALTQLSPTLNSANTAFSWPGVGPFQGRSVDGAELRVYWRYPTGAGTDPLRAAAAVQGCCPRLGMADLRCVAPVRVLSVEGAR